MQLSIAKSRHFVGISVGRLTPQYTFKYFEPVYIFAVFVHINQTWLFYSPTRSELLMRGRQSTAGNDRA